MNSNEYCDLKLRCLDMAIGILANQQKVGSDGNIINPVQQDDILKLAETLFSFINK